MWYNYRQFFFKTKDIHIWFIIESMIPLIYELNNIAKWTTYRSNCRSLTLYGWGSSNTWSTYGWMAIVFLICKKICWWEILWSYAQWNRLKRGMKNMEVSPTKREHSCSWINWRIKTLTTICFRRWSYWRSWVVMWLCSEKMGYRRYFYRPSHGSFWISW